MLKDTKAFIARFTYLPLQRKVAEKIRLRAIQATKARLAIHHHQLEDYTAEELEIIVEEEERKILEDLKTKSLLAVLGLLGISLFP